jgi:DNA-binding SARP family transcriptional activator
VSPREAELEETVLQLRQLLHAEPERITVDRLQMGLGITRYEALILAALHDAGSTWLPVARLNMALPVNDERDYATVKVYVCNIRRALGPDSVLYYTDVGYTLGAPGVLACKRALADAEAA